MRQLILNLIEFTKYSINKQRNNEFLNNLKNNQTFLIFKSKIVYLIKALKLYNRGILFINIIAILNIIITMVLIGIFTEFNIIEEVLSIPLLTSIFYKLTPLFIQDLIYTYYITIGSYIQSNLRKLAINIIKQQGDIVITLEETNNSNNLINKHLTNENPIISENTYNYNNEETVNKDKTNLLKEYKNYIYWGLGFVGLITIVGVTYYYFFYLPRGGGGGFENQDIIPSEIDESQINSPTSSDSTVRNIPGGYTTVTLSNDLTVKNNLLQQQVSALNNLRDDLEVININQLNTIESLQETVNIQTTIINNLRLNKSNYLDKDIQTDHSIEYVVESISNMSSPEFPGRLPSSPDIIIESPSIPLGLSEIIENPHSEHLAPKDSASHYGIKINLTPSVREELDLPNLITDLPNLIRIKDSSSTPIDSAITRSISNTSQEPLRVLPRFNLEGISNIPLPESVEGSSSVNKLVLPDKISPVSSESSLPVNTENVPLNVTKGKFSILPLNVQEPFSETPVVTPESSI
jgi:hypothetical protein